LAVGAVPAVVSVEDEAAAVLVHVAAAAAAASAAALGKSRRRAAWKCRGSSKHAKAAFDERAKFKDDDGGRRMRMPSVMTSGGSDRRKRVLVLA